MKKTLGIIYPKYVFTLVFIIPLFFIPSIVLIQEKKDTLPFDHIPELREFVEEIDSATTLEEISITDHKLGQKVPVNSKSAYAYYQFGKRFRKKQNYSIALYYYLKAAAFYQEIGDNYWLGASYESIAMSYEASEENERALEFHNKALNVAKEISDIDLEFVIKTNLAITYRKMDSIDVAIKSGLEALAIIDKTPNLNKENHINSLTVLSNTYAEKGNNESALYYIEKGIEIAKKINYTRALFDFELHKAIIYENLNDYNKAVYHINEARQLEKILKKEDLSIHQRIKLNYFQALINYELGKTDEVEYHLQNSIASIEAWKKKNMGTSFDFLYLQLSYQLLHIVYKEQRKSDLAKAYSDKSDALKKALEENKYKTALTDSRIQTLQQQKKLDTLIANIKKDQQKLLLTRIGLFISILLIIIVIFVYIIKIRKNEAKFNKLMQKINELEAIESKQEKEKLTKKVSLDLEKVAAILKRLDKLEEQEYFLHLDCTLRSMAKKVKSNYTYLSQIINTHKGKNFNDYLNDLRIEYVLKRLKNDTVFRAYSIKSIATEIGYKSDSSFTKHFKLKTGLNPSFYIKRINELDKKNNPV